MSSNKNASRVYSENWLPIKTIQNDVIVTANNSKVAGVKIVPRNIFILDESSQNAVLTSLKNFYNTLDYEFWLVVSDRPVDVSVYLSQLQLLYNDITVPSIRKLIVQDIEKAQSFINNNIVDTEYYILFKEKNMDLVQKKVRNLINGLAGCGINSSQASNDDLKIVLEGFLNGGKTTEFGTVIV